MKPPFRQQTSLASNPPSSASSSAAALSALTPILDAFNHRHRNQHRSSHWWSIFRILRRTIRALGSDILSPSTSRRAHRDATPTAPFPRARWLDAHLIPRAYLAFTQLAADNQHAPLGLMLLTVLARIHAILSDLLPDRSTYDLLLQPSIPKSKSLLKNQTTSTNPDESLGIDRGVTISRNDVPPAQHVLPKPKLSSTKSDLDELPSRGDPDNKKQERVKDTKEKKKKKKKGDELASLFGSLA